MNSSDLGRVAVIGAGGHVGLPLSIVLARSGFLVTGIDRDAGRVAQVASGEFPFIEEHGPEYLAEALEKKSLTMTTDISLCEGADVVIIVMGTPVDDHMNPRLEPLSEMFTQLVPFLRAGQLIILRSTVAPGTTQRLRRTLEAATGLDLGKDLHLVFAPERVLQGKSIAEIESLPQLVGAFSDDSFRVAEAFFAKYVKAPCIQLTPVEAELGKLVTNMARYVKFAFANEVYLLAESWGANVHRLIEGVNLGYPRADIARPGPNVGGPCLYKDGYFLVERIAFPDLITTAFKINEGMTAQIVKTLEGLASCHKVGILGMAFKADIDDTRESLSFKLRKQLYAASFDPVAFDPLVKEFDDPSVLAGCDAVVLMTPHSCFRNLSDISVLIGNGNCMMIDIWGHWESAKYFENNGMFRLGDFA